MKQALIIFFIISSLTFAFGQTTQIKPLTQTEYVKMLYEVEKNPNSKQNLIDTIRRRGIGFELTSGLRSLTISKSKSDAELKRTIEEAERRRTNPTTAQLPSSKEADEVLEKARKNTLDSLEDMPDFVVKQQIQRSYSFAGTNNFKNLDRLVVAVSYRASGQEEYKVLSVNGVLQNNPQAKQSYAETGGTSSTGEFVTVLAKIFKPESETKFQAVDTDLLRGHRAIVYDYSIERDKAQQQITFFGYIGDSTISGMKGKIWIDRDANRVLRIESEATEIPANFAVRAAKRNIDYDWVSISNEKYLLPLLSDVRLTSRQKGELYETRNLIRFKDYQKFGTDVIILDDDTEVIPDPKP